jgi:hypothetical protein
VNAFHDNDFGRLSISIDQRNVESVGHSWLRTTGRHLLLADQSVVAVLFARENNFRRSSVSWHGQEHSRWIRWQIVGSGLAVPFVVGAGFALVALTVMMATMTMATITMSVLLMVPVAPTIRLLRNTRNSVDLPQIFLRFAGILLPERPSREPGLQST